MEKQLLTKYKWNRLLKDVCQYKLLQDRYSYMSHQKSAAHTQRWIVPFRSQLFSFWKLFVPARVWKCLRIEIVPYKPKWLFHQLKLRFDQPKKMILSTERGILPTKMQRLPSKMGILPRTVNLSSIMEFSWMLSTLDPDFKWYQVGLQTTPVGCWANLP